MAPEQASSPFFSVIISSRNRPVLFRRALQSVVAQSFTDREIIVVVDGCNDEFKEEYLALQRDFADVAFIWLEHRERGHGQSYTMNHGVDLARGQYLCFLDDDDYWTDQHYLQWMHESIAGSAERVDMHYSNQKAFHADGTEHRANVWLEDLIPLVHDATAHMPDSFLVSAEFLLRSDGFAHLNCSTFRRDFYLSIGGMDESIRYENDRDVYVRSIDAAQMMLYSTKFMSRHNIPDGSMRVNMSTAASAVDKKLYQIRVYDKGICQSNNPAVIKRCRMGKCYELKHLTELLAKRGLYSRAGFYAREALNNGFNLRWLAYTLYLSLKGLLTTEPTNGSA